jgi:tetratricopeptide (TPR) repeat protein
VLARHPGNLDALVEKSGAEARRGRRDVARALLLKVLKADPQHALAHEYLGRVLGVENDLAGAALSLSRSLDINPLNTPARLALAALRTEAGQLEAATQQYLLAQALHHGNSEGLNLVATHMAENGHAEDAIKLFRELATMEPDALPAMLVNIGNAQINLGDEGAAAASFKQALKADPSYALAYRRLGNLEDWNENSADAAAYYARACVYEPEDPLNQSSAGTAYLRNGKPEKAREYLSESLRLLPEQPHILYNLAAALLQCGEPEGAVDRLTEAVRMDGRYTNAWQLKAHIEVQIGRPAEAAESVRQVLDGTLDMPAKQAESLRAFAQANGLSI